MALAAHRGGGAAGGREKAEEMSNFVNDLEVRYPSHEETEALLRKARRLRAEAVHDGLVSIRELLQRAVTRAPILGEPHKA